MRGKLVVGNWKMNGGLRQNDALLAELRAGWTRRAGTRQLAVCVPFPYLWQAQAALVGFDRSRWGAQNVSEHASGAYTGEVSAAMLAEFGCSYVDRRPFGAAASVWRNRRGGRGQGGGGAGRGHDADRVRRRNARRARRGSDRKTVVLRQLDAVIARAGAADGARRWWPTSRCGRSARGGRRRRRRRRQCTRRCASGLREHGRRRTCCCSTAAASRPTTRRRCSRCADIDGGLIGGASLKAENFWRLRMPECSRKRMSGPKAQRG